MNSPDSSNFSEKQLWRRFAGERGAPAGACPSAGDLAAYLDGRLGKDERDAMESHLAACRTCLAAAREVRSLLDAQGETLIAPPQSVIDAARALVAAPSRPATVPAQRGFRLADWRPAARWGLTAAASIAICFVGYHVGESVFAVRGAAEDQLIAEISFGVLDPQSEREIDAELFAFGFGEVSR